jgi:hypothetical protein
MGIAKTSLGIFAGSLAVDAFKAEGRAGRFEEKLLLKAIGSVAAATSVHMLKDEVLATMEQFPKRITQD